MKRKLEFFVLCVLVTATRYIDIIGTYHYTPTLKAESNPLVQVFHIGWMPLILIQIFAVLLSCGLNYWSLFRVAVIDPPAADFTFSEYTGYLFLGIKSKSGLINLTKKYTLFGPGQTVHMYGWVLPRILVYVGIVTTIMHLLLTYVPAYRPFERYVIVPIYISFVLFVGLGFFLYFKMRYRNFKNQNQLFYRLQK